MSASFYDTEISKVIAQEWRNGATTEELRKKYGYKTKKSILDKLKKEGITTVDFKSRREELKGYSLDLSVIDDEFKAYFLGLMATDGYLSCSRDNACGIDLTDEDCIKAISDYTGKEYQQYDKSSYNMTQTKYDIYTKKAVYRIRFDSADLVQELKKRGIDENKSLTIKQVKLFGEEQKYYPLVIRGIIDGDGTISRRCDGQVYLKICSASKDFAEWIKDILEQRMFFENVAFYQKDLKDRNPIYEVFTSSAKNIELLRLLSYYSPLGMARKRDFLLGRRSETIIEPSLQEKMV